MTTLRRKVATTVYLEPGQIEGLRATARAGGTTVAALVRQSIDQFLNPPTEELLDALERARPGFLTSLAPAQREELARALAVKW